jgi:hypothetical protein
MVKKRQSNYRPGQSLKIPDFKTIGSWKWYGCQPYLPAAFTRRKYSWYSFLLEDESNPRLRVLYVCACVCVCARASIRCQPFRHFAVGHVVSSLSAILSVSCQPFCKASLQEVSTNYGQSKNRAVNMTALFIQTLLHGRIYNQTVSVLSYSLTGLRLHWQLWLHRIM